MARLKLLWLLALAGGILGQLAWAEPVLRCKTEIAAVEAPAAPPSDVAVDTKGRVYVLYEGDGFLDVYDDNGKLLQHRGGTSEREAGLTSIVPLSMWVGRLGRSALLVSEAGQQIVRAVLIPDQDKLVTVNLKGQPDPISGPCALARDLEGRFYVWSQNQNRVLIFDANGQYTSGVSVSGLGRPSQLAVDSEGQIYCLDAKGLTVLKSDGGVAFEIPEVNAMYLTGSDHLAVASRDWVRRYSHDGRIEIDLKFLDIVKKYEPVAISTNDESQFFVYGRDPMSGRGVIQKLSAKGEVLSDFPQSVRRPAAPDPGTRLDYEGRIRFWDKASGRWLKIHPSGKREAFWAFQAQSDDKGRLAKPAGLVIDGSDTVWVADAGNCRLQRFSLSKGGWLRPVPIAIQGGEPQGAPRSLALGRGVVYCVVYPPRGRGAVVLQSISPEGRVMAQRSVCSAQGDPVVKVACGPDGDIFLYQSRVKVLKEWQDNPTLTRFSRSFQKLAEVGGDTPGMNPPGHPEQRLFLKPQESLIPYGQGLLMPTNGKVYLLNGKLKIVTEYQLEFKRHTAGAENMEDFGGGAMFKKLLYLSDMGNMCVQRVNLP
jgi:sugar lactone lactonase YvrE